MFFRVLFRSFRFWGQMCAPLCHPRHDWRKVWHVWHQWLNTFFRSKSTIHTISQVEFCDGYWKPTPWCIDITRPGLQLVFFWFSAQRDVQLLAHFVPAAVSLLALIRLMLAWIVVAVRCPQFAKFPTVFFGDFAKPHLQHVCFGWILSQTMQNTKHTNHTITNSFDGQRPVFVSNPFHFCHAVLQGTHWCHFLVNPWCN